MLLFGAKLFPFVILKSVNTPNIRIIFLSYAYIVKLFYDSKYMSVHPYVYVCLSEMLIGKMWFSQLLLKIDCWLPKPLWKLKWPIGLLVWLHKTSSYLDIKRFHAFLVFVTSLSFSHSQILWPINFCSMTHFVHLSFTMFFLLLFSFFNLLLCVYFAKNLNQRYYCWM